MDTNVLHNISYGMYVVSSNKDKFFNGQIANTIFQITSSPVAIAASINKENLTHEYIEASRQFSVSILEQDTPLSFIGQFGFKSGKAGDKLKGVKYKVLNSGCPVVLDYTLGFLEAQVLREFDCGTHTLFIARVVDSEMLKSSRPLTYDYYHQVKRGTTPKAAPTFIQGEIQKARQAGFAKYRCSLCNYIYDPQIGDPDNGIPAGTLFEKLPDNWVCPVCGAGKDKFIFEG